ncbi:MAG: cytosine permease [Acidocella sp.]|nr:cytosine permease [Acidocella sp.]
MVDAITAHDALGHIETRGIEFIPEAERHSKPREMGFVFFGTQITYGSLAIGALPVIFGLDWLGTLTAIIAGTLIGSLAVALMALMGPKAGTNSTVTSAAFFGIRGRYVGSFITQIIDLGYFAMILWVSAPPLVQAGHMLFGLPDGNGALTVALLGTAIIVLGLAIFGHATLVAWEKFTSYANLVCLVLLVAVCIGNFHAAPDAKICPLVLGSYWPSWMLAVTVCISNAISYAPYAGDYARYMPTRTSGKAMFWWPFGGMVVGCLIACLCGELIALSVDNPNNASSLMLTFLPHVLVLPVVIIGLIGNATNGGMVAYNGMLDLQAMLYRLTRVQVGLIFSAVGLVVGYLGLVAFNLSNSILALCSIVAVLVTPWTVINVIGYLRHGQRFAADELQAFDKPAGLYWYNGGFNIAAVVSWIVAVAVGMMFSDTALFNGPFSQAANGVDLSFLSAAVVGGVLYTVLDRVLPGTSAVQDAHAAAAE